MVPLPQTSLGLQAIPQHLAAQAFAAAGVTDPEGTATPESMARAGKCFRLDVPHGSLVISVGEEGGALWCYAAAGEGQRMYLAADAALTRIARLSGCARVGFQTLRPGLVRRAKSLGYTVTGVKGAGFEMQKAIP